MAWARHQPLLVRRFPGTSSEDLQRARAFAYGGSVVPDLGYYPFGSHYFSNLVHYARSGDFVATLVRDARDVDEYAFALGVVAHYCSDTTGHPAVNRSVAVAFPKLRARYGNEVTYYDGPAEHIRTEFGFDVVQVAKNRYTADRYHDFIGFEVSKPALDRALQATYGLRLEDTLGHVDLAIGSFRRAVSQAIPELTRIALASDSIRSVPETHNAAEKRFVYELSRADYEKEWGTSYRRPLHDHARRGFQGIPDDLRRHVLAYRDRDTVGERGAPGSVKAPGHWRRTLSELDELAAVASRSPAAPKASAG